jgi:hypothetical protein
MGRLKDDDDFDLRLEAPRLSAGDRAHALAPLAKHLPGFRIGEKRLDSVVDGPHLEISGRAYAGPHQWEPRSHSPL